MFYPTIHVARWILWTTSLENYFILFYIITIKMKKWKIIMFTTLWTLGMASLFLMGSSNAGFGWISKQRLSSMQSMSAKSTYKDFVGTVAGTKMEWKVTEEKFNEMKTKLTERNQKREAAETAIKNHDYNAWKTLHKWTDILEKINSEAKFEKFIEMRSVMVTAKDKVDAIAKELWIEKWMGQMMWKEMWLKDWTWLWMWKGKHQWRWFWINKK